MRKRGKLYKETVKIKYLPLFKFIKPTETKIVESYFHACLDDVKDDFPFVLWQGNPESITFYPKGRELPVDSSFLEMYDAMQKFAVWYKKWFGLEEKQ
jgi:hypothetical protein